MKKIVRLLLSLIIISTLIVMLFVTSVNATSWARLEPKMVDQRAELIVLGKYDFTNKLIRTEGQTGIFTPVLFKVEKYYRGSGNDLITTGIDMFDTEWVKEFQDEGGTFLLFLERSNSDSNFFVPVGGPNGMIEILDNKVKSHSQNAEAYFSRILLGQTQPPTSSIEKSNYLIYLICAFLFLMLLTFVIKKFSRIRE